MTKILPFHERPQGELVARTTLEDAGIDVERIARELWHYQAEVRERLRQAALRAIDEELEKIRAERKE